MSGWRWKAWRFSVSLVLARQLKKGYLAYDSNKRHICFHAGTRAGKLTCSLTRISVYQGSKKPRKKVLYV